LLRRFINRGVGVVIKSSSSLTENYFIKVEKFKSDCIFVLDKPSIDEGFLKLAEEKNLTVIHIDHHPPEPENKRGKYYYNPMLISNTNEPVSDICYRISARKEDLWIAVAGCISDAQIPDFINELENRNPELIKCKYKSAFDILYNSEIGKIIILMSFGLRDNVKNVESMINFFVNSKNSAEVFEDNEKTSSFLRRFEHIKKKYDLLIHEARNSFERNILFFSYSGEIGLNRDMANELMYFYPNKIIVVVFIRNFRANISLRWSKGDIRKPALEAIKDIDGATGGGHEHAPGVQMLAEDVSKFKENLFRELEKED
jgi:hypothetical protein